MGKTATGYQTRVISVLVLALSLAGCPRKLVEERIVEVPKNCPPTEAPAPPVQSMSAVALVTAGAQSLVVLATPTYAKVAKLGDKVGAEGGAIIDISKQAVTVRLPNATTHQVPVTTKLQDAVVPAKKPAVAVDGNGGKPAAVEGGTPPAAQANSAEDTASYARWRLSVMGGMLRGLGVPVHVIHALILSLADHTRPSVATALNSLGWSNLPSISEVYYTKVSVTGNKAVVEGVSPSKRTFDMVLRRLKGANPRLSSVKTLNEAPAGNAYGFKLIVEAPLVGATNLAVPGVAPSTGLMAAGLAEGLQKKLQTLANKMAADGSLPGFEGHLRGMAERYGVTLDELKRQPVTVDGYMGVVSFDIKGRAPATALLQYLAGLRQEVSAKRPLAVDPLVISGAQFSMTVRVPYATSKADVRKPVPGALMLPKINNARWQSALQLPLDALRDPFKKK